MRWFKKWLRFILLVAIIVSIFLFLFFIITENNILNNDFDDKSYHHMPSSSASFSSSIHPFHQSLLPFKTEHNFRRNSTGLQISEWNSSVDFHHLLDINDFNFIKNGSYLCNSSINGDNNSPFLVVIVHSSPKNILKRKVIRNTWGSLRNINGYKIILVFIIGLINSTELQRSIDDESNLNRDIIQATFVDDYQNLTYKHLTSFKWVLRYCNATKFVMKADDDAFIDIFRAVKVLRETFDSSTVSNTHPRDIIACSLFPDGTAPKRAGKWSVSYNEYPYDTYPSYCSGVAYFLTLDVIYDIYEAAHRIQPVLRIDDVFLTGIVAASLHIHHFPLNLKYEYDDKRLREWLYSSNLKPSSYLVADIGNVRDWQSLMSKLWIKTVHAWSLY